MRCCTTFIVLFCACLISGSHGAGCAEPRPSVPEETWPALIFLDRLEPLTILPGTELNAHGSGFVGTFLGSSRLVFLGEMSPQSGGSIPVSATIEAEVLSSDRMRVDLGGPYFSAICPGWEGTFTGSMALQVTSFASGRVYETPFKAAGLHCRTSLSPSLIEVFEGDTYLYGRIPVMADDLLLGTAEGRSMVETEGCFLPRGAPAPCSSNGDQVLVQRLDLDVAEPELRRDGSFVLAADLFGLRFGDYEGTLRIVNIHEDGYETGTEPVAWQAAVLPSRLDGVETSGASLGGFVDLAGRGFVGGSDDEATEILLVGTFLSDKGGQQVPLDLILVAEFQSGERVRYVLDEQDSLGQLVELRQESGLVSGELTPRLVKGASTVTGQPVMGSFRIELLRQVVYVNFTQGYSDALELFGLRTADPLVRRRILEKAGTVYQGINVEFRETAPEDYLLYTQVDITGEDPNGLGLMGYDNTPGKDVRNLRLYDRIGGVNALTQQDGYPGYGGVFVESFFAFSLHPPVDVEPHPSADALFDEIFDPLRPDTGAPVLLEELDGLPLVDGVSCPADRSDRARIIACAVFVLGNLLGGTMAHELGHSLGLADPDGTSFHNAGERPNRIMDAGGQRPLSERAEIQGQGPEVFCQENYFYLQSILPVSEPFDPVPARPPCY